MELDPRDTKISQQEQEIVKAVLHPLMGALASSNDGLVSAGDVTRVLAFAVAAILDTDDQLATPRDIRQAGEYYGKLVAHHIKILRATGEATGTSFMSDIIAHTVTKDG